MSGPLDPPRPALGRVLAALTSSAGPAAGDAVSLDEYDGASWGDGRRRPWTVRDAREGLERLMTADPALAPADVFDATSRRMWWCAVCRCTGVVPDAWTEAQEGCLCGPGLWDAPGACPSLPELAAWASLGMPAILAAEDLARLALPRPDGVVAWCAMDGRDVGRMLHRLLLEIHTALDVFDVELRASAGRLDGRNPASAFDVDVMLPLYADAVDAGVVRAVAALGTAGVALIGDPGAAIVLAVPGLPGTEGQ